MAKRKTVDEYISGLPEWQQEIVSSVRRLITETKPEAQEAVKWSHPVFELDGPFAYIHAFKNHINFGFWRGVDLPDPEGLLDGSGEKMRHVKLTSLEDVNEGAFRKFVKSAVDLNQTEGDPTKGK
jgi:hypothetical protein